MILVEYFQVRVIFMFTDLYDVHPNDGKFKQFKKTGVLSKAKLTVSTLIVVLHPLRSLIWFTSEHILCKLTIKIYPNFQRMLNFQIGLL